MAYANPISNGDVNPTKNSTEGARFGPPDVLEGLISGQSVDPGRYCFHLHVKIETGHPKYKWLNNRVIIARAQRQALEVAYDAYVMQNPEENLSQYLP